MCAHVHRHADSGVCARACVYLHGYVCASWVGICVQHTYVCLSVRECVRVCVHVHRVTVVCMCVCVCMCLFIPWLDMCVEHAYVC